MIYFMAPDWLEPVGGIRHMYDMVDGLNELGYEARVFHGAEGFRCRWFENATAVVASPELRLEVGDVLVVPEYRAVELRDRVEQASVVVLNQSHFCTFLGAGFDDDWPGAYPGLPSAAAVIATSQAIEQFVSASLRAFLPLHRVRCVVDTGLFEPDEKRKVIAISMKGHVGDVEAVVQLFHRSNVLDGWELRPIGGMCHSAVAVALRDAAICVTLSDREGIGLLRAEAMASGCYVVGFTAGGGRELMSADWCSPIPFPELLAVVTEVERLAESFTSGAPEVRVAGARARAHVVDTYSRSQFMGDLQCAFAELTAPGSAAVQDRSVTVRHWSALTRHDRIRSRVRPFVPDAVVRGVRSAMSRRGAGSTG